MKILFDEQPADGNGNEPETPQEKPADAPPAASTVINGEVTEETLKLKEKLAQTESEKRRVEMRAAELEDENHQLKKVTPTNVPVKKIDNRSALEKYMAGEGID